MNRLRKLTETESIAVDLIKVIAIFSVITAHTMKLYDFSIYAKVISSLWSAFAWVGVVFFFVIGGYFYNRRENDAKAFWKKKFFRLILPWFVCATLTYGLGVLIGNSFDMISYLKWIFGSGSWYYYIVVYVFFMFIFRWLYQCDTVMYIFVAIHLVSLCLGNFGIFLTPQIGFMTNYLNPIYWVGYFSIGVLIRRYNLDLKLQKSRVFPLISFFVMIVSLGVIVYFKIYTYVNGISYVFALSLLVLVARLCYWLAEFKFSAQVRKIGSASYCIYLLHMQIVQKAVAMIPEGYIKVTLAPVLGMVIMVAFVSVCSFVLNKIPFGKKIKMIIGL